MATHTSLQSRAVRTALAVSPGSALLYLVLLAGCSGSGGPTSPAAPPAVTLDLALRTENFELQFSESDSDKMDTYADALEAAHPRVSADLAQAGLPRIVGRFYPDQQSFTAATGWDATGSVQGPNMFSMVASPLQPLVAVHEFAHNVTLHLNGTAANNPTWLWEAVAVFEAEDFIHPRSIPCLVNGEFPTLSQLNHRGGDCDIYRVGYTLAEFIVEHAGYRGLRDLIVAHGNTLEVLGLTASQVEDGWQRFVEEHYL